MFVANWQQPFLAFPAMKAKAAEIKHCLRPLLEVWRLHYMSPHSQEDAEVLLLLQRAADMDDLLDQDRTQAVLLYQDCIRLCVLGFEYFGLMGRLMKRFLLQGDMAFNVTFKAHWLCHGLLESHVLSPRVGACYGQEDLMQIVRRMVSVCTQARNPVATVQTAMQKYVMALHVDYSRM